MDYATASEEEEIKIFNSIRKRDRKATLIMGDFNYSNIDWDTLGEGGDENFIDLINDLFLTQFVRQPTRDKNILDLVFSSDKAMVNDLVVSDPVANSDHNVITWSCICSAEEEERTSKDIFDYNKGNYEAATIELRKTDWEGMFRDLSVDKMWIKFTEAMRKCRDRYIPVRVNNKRKQMQWMTYKLKNGIKRRNRLWDKHNKHPDYTTLEKYREQRNRVIEDIGEAKLKFERKMAQNIKSNPTSFCAYVNSKRVGKDTIGPLKDDNGDTVSDRKGMGNILNKYFASVFTEEKLANIPKGSNLAMEGKLLSLVDIKISVDSIGRV